MTVKRMNNVGIVVEDIGDESTFVSKFRRVENRGNFLVLSHKLGEQQATRGQAAEGARSQVHG